MERIFRNFIAVAALAAGILIGPRALSEVRFEPAISSSNWEDEQEFAPSRFGEGPANPIATKKDVLASTPRTPSASRGIASVEETTEESEDMANDSEVSDQGSSEAPRTLVQIDPAAPPSMARRPASPLSPSQRGVQEVAVIANDLGYFPKTIFVTRNIPVRLFITSASRRNNLCLMVDAFRVARQIRAEKIEEVTFTPATPGKHRFYCPVNGMEGTLIVKDVSVRD